MCIYCGKLPPINGLKICTKCSEKSKIRRNHSDGMCGCGRLLLVDGLKTCILCKKDKKERNIIKKKNGLCYMCNNPAIKGRFCEKHYEYNRINGTIRNIKKKLIVILHYNGKCEICGETNFDLLCVDHINNDGAQHRKQLSNASIYRHLIKNNFPINFRLLCCNCNGEMSLKFRRKTLDKFERYHIRRSQLKLDIFNHYGGPKCMRCEDINIDHLCLDHINGGGHKHTKEIGRHLYYWVHKNNYPSGFQVLCFNCNYLKSIQENKYTSLNSPEIQEIYKKLCYGLF